jgi:hypothetical protein
VIRGRAGRPTVGRVSEFWPRPSPPRRPGTAAPRAADIAAAEQASQPAAPMRFLRAIVVPAEETGFLLRGSLPRTEGGPTRRHRPARLAVRE